MNLTTVAPWLAKEGIWGPVTATLDWCEVNHQFSPYIAEMANSLSNLFTVGIALAGFARAHKQNLPTRYAAGFLGIALVGIGSFFFHATLQFHAQLADELPMIYVGTMGVWLLFDNKPGFGLSSSRTRSLVGIAVVFDILFSWSYFINRNPIYHQVVFGSMVLGTALRVAYILRHTSAALRIPDNKKQTISYLFASGAVLFALGFVIWNLDNAFCHSLTNLKLKVGWPMAFFLEGHSWWHVFTGIGTYYMFSGIQYITLCTKDDPAIYDVGFKHGLPHIVRLGKDTKVI